MSSAKNVPISEKACVRACERERGGSDFAIFVVCVKGV